MQEHPRQRATTEPAQGSGKLVYFVDRCVLAEQYHVSLQCAGG